MRVRRDSPSRGLAFDDREGGEPAEESGEIAAELE